MALKTQIEADIKAAMLAREKDALLALRAIKSLILLEETKEGSAGGGLSAEDEIKLLNKAAKQRRDALEIYKTQNRPELAEKEQAELSIIERYLPAQLSPEALTAQIRQIVAEVGATSPADMGKVMGAASKRLAGQAEGKAISSAVKEVLSSL